MTVSASESVLIVSSDEGAVDRFKQALDVGEDSTIRIETKYYKSSIPIESATTVAGKLDPDVKAVILIEDPQYLSQLSDLEDDVIKILYSSSCDAIDACIETGFELVLSEPAHPDDSEEDFGPGRVKKALECRMWSDLPQPASVDPEKILVDFDDLMNRIKTVRDSALSQNCSDDQRRARAAAAALELAALLAGDDSEEIDSD
jgi:hypothetical protein